MIKNWIVLSIIDKINNLIDKRSNYIVREFLFEYYLLMVNLSEVTGKGRR